MSAIATSPMSAAQAVSILFNNAESRRRQSSIRGRHKKAAHRASLVTAAGGDVEQVKLITLWQPSHRAGKLFAAGYGKIITKDQNNKDLVVTDHENFSKMEIDVIEEHWVLVEEAILRALPPAAEQARAAKEGRYVAKTGGTSFFAPAPIVRYAKRPTDNFAPLGDFEWVDRSPEHEAALTANRTKNAKRAALPITRPPPV